MNKYIISIVDGIHPRGVNSNGQLPRRVNSNLQVPRVIVEIIVKIIIYIIITSIVCVIGIFLYKFWKGSDLSGSDLSGSDLQDCLDDRWDCSVKSYSMCIDGFSEGDSRNIESYIFENLSSLGEIVTVNNPNTLPHELAVSNIILGELDDSSESCSKQNFQFICENPCSIKE